jgi:protein SCO1/2
MTDGRPPMNETAASTPQGTLRQPGLTLAACAVVAAAFLAALAHLTVGFEYWTFEAGRRHDAASGRLAFPPMRLVDESGRAWQLPAGGTGRVMLVVFIYTRCPFVCQSLGVEFYRVQQRILTAGSGIRLLSVSVDPARDTPAALAEYARLHRANALLWRISAPVSVDEGRTARRMLGVIAVDDGMGGFVHNGAIHVVDTHGRVAGIFDTADWQRALALAQRLDARAP